MVIKLSDKQIDSVKNGYSEIILNPLQEKAIEEKAMQGIRDEIIQSLRDMRIAITDSEAESIAIDFEESSTTHGAEPRGLAENRTLID